MVDVEAWILAVSLVLIPLVVVLEVTFCFVVLFVERDDPTRVLHWLMILIFWPVVGVGLYLYFHKDMRLKQRLFADHALTFLRIPLREATNTPPEAATSAPASTAEERLEFGDLSRLANKADAQAVLSAGNRVQLFVQGSEKFKALIEDLKAAKEHIHLEYYIVRDDALSHEILSVLAERARAGVEVRMVVDAVGGRPVRRMARSVEGSGVKFAYFLPRLTRINFRNHRKLAIVDGRIGYCGGYNIGEEYLGKGPLGNWRDCAVRIVGPGVDQLQMQFMRDWTFASKEEVPGLWRYLRGAPEKSSAMLQRVSSGPDTSQQWVKLSYMKMISMAKESCYIQTPYFMPDASMMDALRVAAASGVDVRLMIPCKPDHWFLFWASQSFCADLLKSGVRSFKYDKGFLHAKTVVVDGKVGSVGSANVDPRSFHLNFETNVIIFDESLGAQMRDAFLEDQKVCTELTPELYAKRGLVVRFKEPFCRLLYPVQ
jgi:cardiolipin synthase